VPEAARWWITAYDNGRPDAALWVGNAAFSLVVEAAKSKKPVANFVIEQARKWLRIAAEHDPEAKNRENAKEELRLLENLLAGH
jgi:hypothetical protein